MAEANPDDGLMADIAREYKLDRPRFVQTAQAWVKRFATGGGERKRKLSQDDPSTKSKEAKE